MSTVIPFNPSDSANFQFQPLLDGNTYTGIVTWNAYAGRYYVGIYTLQGVLVLNIPLISSPTPITQNCYNYVNSPLLAPSVVNQNIVKGSLVVGPGIPAGTTIIELTTPPSLPISRSTPTGSITQASGRLMRLSNYSTSSNTNVGFLFTYGINLLAGYFTSQMYYFENSSNIIIV